VFSKINLTSIFSLSILVTSNFYFYSARGIFINYTTVLIQLISLLIFSLFFFYSLKFISKNIKEKYSNFEKLLAIIILIWLLKEAINSYFLISNKSTFGKLFVFLFQDFINNEYISLIVERLFPYLVCIILIYTFKNYKEKLFRLIKITGVIIFIYFVYEFSIRYLESYKNYNNYFDKKISENISNKKKILWVIFDEYDYNYAFENHLAENIKNISQTSVSSSNALPPGPNTIVTMPATLMNVVPKGVGSNDKFMFIVDRNNKEKEFKYENTIFKKLDEVSLKYQIFSSMIPYCSILNIKKNCKEKLSEWYRGIIFEYSLINKMFTFTNYSKNYFSGSKKKITTEKIINSKLIKNIDHSESIDGHKNFNYNDLKEVLKKDINFIFMHLYLPHLPAQYAMSKYDLNLEEEDHLKKYYLNLKISDLVIKNIFEILEKNIDEKNKEEMMVIFSSDHWYRFGPDRKRSYDKDKKAYPVIFLSKVLSDQENFDISKKINLLSIHDLILNFFEGRINSNKEINNFLINQKFHEPFLDTVYR
tara:strand:- start:623 stop:2227 length:1605 start_codon:yes stop_codon:yes gene_type:complete